MNLSHFHRKPLFTHFRDLEPFPEHEQFTLLSYELPAGWKPGPEGCCRPPNREHAVLFCRCGWRIAVELFAMYDEPREKFFERLSLAARGHALKVRGLQ